MGKPVVEMRHIYKRFAKTLANDDVSLTVNPGEVVALLGENGAGKSTIMKILYGLYHKTSGEILIDGKERDIQTPRDAMDLGICMVQQHFTLIPAQTVTENIILGTYKGRIDYNKEQHEVEELSKKYGFEVPAGAYVKDLPVGIQQKVEILKALHRHARILIMDEPTAVLIPQEIDVLIHFIRDFAAERNSVIFITHKMKEVMDAADRIIIMRNGAVSGCVNKKDVTATQLARLMIGHDLEVLKKPESNFESQKKRVEVNHVSIELKDGRKLLNDLNFSIHAGEILGIAGVSGNGQEELCKALYGALHITQGSVKLDGEDITHKSVKEHIALGIGYCPADRYRYGMVSDMSLTQNMMLKSSYLGRWDKHGFINWSDVSNYTEDVIKKYNVKAPDTSVTIGSLSGGNQQKLVVGREVDMGTNVVIFNQPTRGLDLGAITNVQKVVLQERAAGKSVLLISTELSELFDLSDRIAVMYQGSFVGIFKPEDLNVEKIGLLMAGVSLNEAEGGSDGKE